ncbi:MAG TPA: HlyD family secretion protein [Rhodanobacteraceae bacterium]|nr:HlyD family secretion protein [Rhodanobacteraceae bacterium]
MTDKQYGAPDVGRAQSPVPARKRGQRLLWVAGPLLVALVAGYFYLTAGRYVSTDNAYVGADQVTIAPQVGGRVVEVAVQQNQRVSKGDLLFRIDPEPLQLSADALRAQARAVGEYLASTKDSYHAAMADLGSSEATLKHDQAQLRRMEDLRKRGLVAQKALDDARKDVAVARGDRDSDAAAVAKARTLLGGNVDAPVEDLAGYKAIGAQLDKAELDLSHATVRAPMDGVIGKMSLQPGDYLQVGQAAMPLVATTVWVDANFKETDLTHVRVGQAAVIKLDAYPDYQWHARVASISPASGAAFSVLPAQNATGNWVKIVQRIPLRLTLVVDDAKAPRARVGMSAEVEIDTGAENSLWGRWFGGADAADRAVAGN